jgi:lysine 2,3-aminomutase
VAEGVAIIEGLRGHTTGYAIPQFVIDGPGGGGKIPINPNYIVESATGRVTLRNFEGKIFDYPDPTPIPARVLERLHHEAAATSV